MAWDDYVFEDPMESYERGQEEPMEEVKLKCSKCGYEFHTLFASACHECGGWTDVIGDNDGGL